ncbi:MAG: methylenetetrahydrofolate reductase [NAD(P)H] [Chloroflexi bacterium]|nr:methylenetetrahydrofolate reductase [NAD(P)H] [Chloroflexota bacterium]MCI0829256.1 methylenetetrahydrofolate reductase [NAD(P)H] [Chloroflexota bacterium]MCI0847999.1 methylenetetrahydrofolate reductase [NAD(P)H] [Chloroflexota bacterium]MCI0898172.1 methylenetetrahydrofolate reductase [NAD(P)H] [Chloroflexota bacterium]MCI0900317.1 methylenetetrahydrofolate reductase [NAD(P)H] [Chloroflexota bacterium]
MKIKDILKKTRPVSFEFFPPRTAEGIPAVLETLDGLKAYHPDFVSITYGAGGSTRAFTEEITFEAKRNAGVEVMAHLTCVGQTKEEIHAVLERLEAEGVENVIALRGDPPRGTTEFVPVEGGFQHATDLLRHIKANFKFGVAAACYPEGHTESVDLDADLKYVKLKVDNGADFLVTQLFYDNRHYYDFVERARAGGIGVPIIPGVLPVLNTAQVRRFTALSGSEIPPALNKLLDKYADDDDSARDMGVEYATAQVRELWDSGVPGVHFYVLNRTYSVSRILDNLTIPGHHRQG